MPSEPADKSVPLIRWQMPMQRVLYALVPVVLASVYFFGWRSLIVLAICNLAAFFTEYAFVRREKKPVTSAVFVTGSLFALSLPPTLPLWMAVVGVAFGVTFGKMVFGGFGRNVFNPALVGRAFIYVSFPSHMNSIWTDPIRGAVGGLAAYASDAVTGATPMTLAKEGAHVPWSRLALGTTAGSLGETCALLVLLGGIYIVWKKAASYRIVLPGLAGMLILQIPLWLAGLSPMDPVAAVLSGSYLFGLFFFITEPVSASQTDAGRWIYGACFGALVAVIRTFSSWREGVMFAVLLANMFAPIMDYAIRAIKDKRETV